MKLRLPFLCAVFGALVATIPAVAENTEFLFGLRSAVVEYQSTTTGRGINNTSTETYWIDDSGRKTARLSQSSSAKGRSKAEPTETLALLLDGWIYNIDLKKKTGMKMSMEQAMRMAASVGMKVPGQNGQACVKDFVEKNGGRWLAPESFLGRTCDVFELYGFKTWAYKGVPLKTEGTAAGITVSQVATKLEENASIPAARFEIPKDVTIQDMPDMSGMLGALMGGGRPRQTQTKSSQPAAQKPVVAEAKPAASTETAKPAAEAKPAPKPVAKKAAKPVAKAETNAVKVTSAEFGTIASKLHVSGYTVMAPESDGGGHTVNLLDTRGGVLGVTMLPISIADGLEKNASLKVDSKFEHDGHPAVVGVLADPSEGDSSIVLVRYPERKLALLVSATPVKPKEELMKLLEQIDL